MQYTVEFEMMSLMITEENSAVKCAKDFYGFNDHKDYTPTN